MSTKANPGKFDCYAKLDEHEPYFLLRAKDPLTPHMIGLWRCLRAGDVVSAMEELIAANERWAEEIGQGRRKFLDSESEKSIEAETCAGEADEWFSENIKP